MKTQIDLDALGRIGIALADETRRALLVALLDGPGYPAELAEALGLTKANVSNHLACLRGCGLVATTPGARFPSAESGAGARAGTPPAPGSTPRSHARRAGYRRSWTRHPPNPQWPLTGQLG